MVLNPHTTYPQSMTYVLKLHHDSVPREGRVIGRLEHVASGHQSQFSSAEELIACLARDPGQFSEEAGSSP